MSVISLPKQDTCRLEMATLELRYANRIISRYGHYKPVLQQYFKFLTIDLIPTGEGEWRDVPFVNEMLPQVLPDQ